MATLAIAGAMSIALLALLGRALGFAPLAAWVPDAAPMVINTALGILLLATSFTLALRPEGRTTRQVATGAAVVVLVLAGLVLAEYALGVDLHIDELAGRDTLPSPALAAPGRVAISTAVGFVLLGVCALLVLWKRTSRSANVLAFTTGVLAYFAILGVAFALPSLYGFGVAARVAPNTAVAVLLLAIAALLVRPHGAYFEALMADDARGVFLRGSAPALFVLPGVIAALHVMAAETNFVSPLTESYLLFAVTTIVLAFFGLTGARAIQAADQARARGAEREIANEARFHAVVESLPDAVFLVDERGLIALVNSAATPTFGYATDEILGKKIELLIPEARRHDHEKLRDAYSKAPRGRPMRERTDLVARKKDGTEFPVDVSLSPVNTREGLFFAAVVQDLTARRAAERARSESEERFREIAENVEEVFWEFDLATGRALYVNPAFEKVFGRSPEALYRDYSAWFDYVHPEDVEAARAVSAEGLLGGPVNREMRIVRPDGATGWIAARSYPVRNERGTAIRIVGVTRDVTERKVAEEKMLESQARAEEIQRLTSVQEARKQFVNTLAHEIGNPLTPLTLQMELLKMGDPSRFNEKDRKSIHVLDTNLQRMRALLSEVRDVSRIESGHLSLQRAKCDLATIAREITETYETAAAGAGIVLTFASDGPIEVTADRQRVAQVVANFVSNALKFTPSGGRITVNVARAAGEAVVRVSDTGLGLTHEQIGQLFRAFSQVHVPSAEIPRGTGLGLFISKGIVEQHGGRIWCESAGPGHGSSFSFALPLTAT